MSEEKIYPVPGNIAKSAYVDAAKYKEMYQRSMDDPEGFWSEQANQYLDWYEPFKKVWDWSYDQDNLYIK
ncbi:MAG: acetyl-coenzyme A synthetase N-terminal domain-containing protein, partial [Acidiferrobacterales bacterium]|nr:acetyl-coenzyme A synthetase N-terminal domain-containing protein [Acidiferrobacterales bacterium]